MKYAVVLLVCVAAASAAVVPNNAFGKGKFYPDYNRFQTQSPFQYRPIVPVTTPRYYVSSTPAPVVVPVPRYSGNAPDAVVLKESNEINPDGSYNYFYETSNGIAAQAQGTPRDFGGNPPVVPDVVQGSFAWTSPEGRLVQISYVADENGYQPTGDALPVGPPVPPQIARALEYLARNAPKQ